MKHSSSSLGGLLLHKLRAMHLFTALLTGVGFCRMCSSETVVSVLSGVLSVPRHTRFQGMIGSQHMHVLRSQNTVTKISKLLFVYYIPLGEGQESPMFQSTATPSFVLTVG